MAGHQRLKENEMAEDFTTYTKVDPNGRLAVTAAQITFTALTRNESAYVYKDYTANHFNGNYSFSVDTQFTTNTAGTTSGASIWALSNSVGDRKSITNAAGDEHAVYLAYNNGAPVLNIVEVVGGVAVYGSQFGISLGTTYYLTISRNTAVGTYGTLYCYVYSDSARTTLLGTITYTLTASKSFRYAYGVQTYNDGVTASLSGFAKSPVPKCFSIFGSDIICGSIIRGLP